MQQFVLNTILLMSNKYEMIRNKYHIVYMYKKYYIIIE